MIQERHRAALPGLGRTESGKPTVTLTDGLPHLSLLDRSIRGHELTHSVGLL